jgi:hypothetical protein
MLAFSDDSSLVVEALGVDGALGAVVVFVVGPDVHAASASTMAIEAAAASAAIGRVLLGVIVPPW